MHSFSDIRFVVHLEKDCNPRNDIHNLAGGTNDYEICKIWCANNAICGGFVVIHSRCWFKDATCARNVVNYPFADIYLKELN